MLRPLVAHRWNRQFQAAVDASSAARPGAYGHGRMTPRARPAGRHPTLPV